MVAKRTLEERLEVEDIFHPKTRSIRVQEQRVLPQVNYAQEILRDFYESVAKAIFSGESRNRQKEQGIEPDLSDSERARYIEVKATGHTRRVMLKDGQMEKYETLQVSNFPIPNPRIYVVIFRYAAREIHKEVKGFSTKEVINYLTKNTSFMLGLPYSLAHNIHKQGYSGNGNVTRFAGEKGTPCTYLSTRLIDQFFTDPQAAISSLSLDPNNFLIRKTKIGALRVNRFSLTPFPMTMIKDSDKYHKKFVRELNKERNKEVPF